MWDSRVDLRVHYATCRSLAYQIGEFLANQHSFNLSTSKADELNDMVAAMIEHLTEVEDLWDEVAETARACGPDDPRDGSLLKDWSNVILIKGVVSDTMTAIDRYTFPSSRPRYGNERLSYSNRDFSCTSSDVSTEDELDESEDGSTNIGTSQLTNGTRQCHTCGTSGKWHTPWDCPVVSRRCR